MGLSGRICCLGPLSALILLGIVHSQESTTTTTAAPISAAANCSATLLQCMNNNTDQNKCVKAQNRLSCYGNTGPYGCSVNDQVVSFGDLLPTFTAICNETNTQGSCWQFMQCLMTTDYGVMTNALNYTSGPSQDQAQNLTHTGFWCRYMTQSMSCLNNHADNCGMSDVHKAVFDSLAYWHSPTCDGKEVSASTKCRDYVSACMIAAQPVNGSRTCEAQLTEMTCLASSSNHGCIVKELNNVTFDLLSNVHPNVCEVVNPVVAEECSAMVECVDAGYYGRLPGLYSMQGPPSVLFSRLLTTDFWCQHLKQMVNCFLKTASACQISTNGINTFKTNTSDYIKKLCAGELSNAGGFNYNGATTISTIAFFTHVWALILLPLFLTQTYGF